MLRADAGSMPRALIIYICTVSNDDVGVLHDFLALDVIVVVQAMLATSRMLTISASSPYRRRPTVSLVLVLASFCVRGGPEH